jgi:hypothetical protein
MPKSTTRELYTQLPEYAGTGACALTPGCQWYGVQFRSHRVRVGGDVLLWVESAVVDCRPAAAADVEPASSAADGTRPRRGLHHTVDRRLQRWSMAHSGNHTGDSSKPVSCREYATAYNFLYGLRRLNLHFFRSQFAMACAISKVPAWESQILSVLRARCLVPGMPTPAGG